MAIENYSDWVVDGFSAVRRTLGNVKQSMGFGQAPASDYGVDDLRATSGL